LIILYSQKELDENEDDSDSILPNLYEMSHFFEQVGVGLSREEMIRIWLSMKQLIDTRPVDSIRFWGKIIGTERCYIVVECEYREGEEDEEEEDNDEVKKNAYSLFS